MITPRSATNIATLHVEVQPLAVKFLNDAAASSVLPSGWTVSIISGSRTYAEQTALYAQGRTTPGKRVTNAPAGYSLHNFGLAFDIGIFNEQGKYIDDVVRDSDPYYKALAPIGHAAGLEWGGDWSSMKDYPHYQFNPLGLSLGQMRERTARGESLFA